MEEDGAETNLEKKELVTFRVNWVHTRARGSCEKTKQHMYMAPESPAEVFVKHSITKTRGFEDDKCVPKESVIGSGIKGLPCL